HYCPIRTCIQFTRMPGGEKETDRERGHFVPAGCPFRVCSVDVARRVVGRKHMVSVLDRAKNTVRRHQNLAMDLYWETRQRHPAVDHLVRAYERYSDSNGTQLASAVTYYAFLSFFPLLALAFAVVGFLAARNVELTDHLNKALEAVLPGLSEQLPVEQIAEARVGAGLLGVLGLLYAGLNV